MKTIQELINEGVNKTPGEQMYDQLVDYFENGGNVQLVVELFLTKCFDEAPHKDFHTAVGDAVNNIYDEYIK